MEPRRGGGIKAFAPSNFSRSVDPIPQGGERGGQVIPATLLKVSKSRKQILKFSFEPKNERKYFRISAQASKSGGIKKLYVLYYDK